MYTSCVTCNLSSEMVGCDYYDGRVYVKAVPENTPFTSLHEHSRASGPFQPRISSDLKRRGRTQLLLSVPKRLRDSWSVAQDEPIKSSIFLTYERKTGKGFFKASTKPLHSHERAISLINKHVCQDTLPGSTKPNNHCPKWPSPAMSTKT